MIILLLFLILLALLVPGFVRGVLQLVFFGVLALISRRLPIPTTPR
jgi:hypothetical protein